MELIATLETRISKEGKSYKVIVLNLTDTYEKLVFLNAAELALLEATNK